MTKATQEALRVQVVASDSWHLKFKANKWLSGWTTLYLINKERFGTRSSAAQDLVKHSAPTLFHADTLKGLGFNHEVKIPTKLSEPFSVGPKLQKFITLALLKKSKVNYN